MEEKQTNILLDSLSERFLKLNLKKYHFKNHDQRVFYLPRSAVLRLLLRIASATRWQICCGTTARSQRCVVATPTNVRRSVAATGLLGLVKTGLISGGGVPRDGTMSTKKREKNNITHQF